MSVPYPMAIPSNGFADFWALQPQPPSVDQELQRKIARQWDAYNGRLRPSLRTRRNAPDDNVSSNVSRVIVETGVSFLFGRGVTWNLDQEDTRSPNEQYLDKVWAYNRQDALLHRLGINGGVCGQAFLKIRIERPYPRLVVIDPTMVTVQTAQDDYEHVLSYTIRWRVVDAASQKETNYRQVIERVPAGILNDGTVDVPIPEFWKITDQHTEAIEALISDQTHWVTDSVESWPYSFAPIVDCFNLPAPNRYWGLSDLEPDVIHLNEIVNRVLSNVNKILRLHAHPKTWTKGLTESQIQQISIDPEGMIHLPGEAGAMQNLEMQSDLASSLNYYQKTREALAELSRVPEIASGKVDQNFAYLSAMAMQILYGPLITKTLTKRASYGHLLIEANRRLLALAGQGDEQVCDLVWAEILPRDAQVEAQTALVESQLGVSRDTLLTKLGYKPAYERERRQADAAEDAANATMMAKAQAAGQPQPAGQPQAKPAAPSNA